MANENKNQGGNEGRNDEFDSDKKKEFGQGQRQGETGQRAETGGQQGQQSEFGQQGQAQTNTADRTRQSGGQPGTEGSGFVGSQDQDSGEYLQDRDPQQAGFAEQGRGAPEDGSDIEGGGERSENRSSDIEGSSENR